METVTVLQTSAPEDIGSDTGLTNWTISSALGTCTRGGGKRQRGEPPRSGGNSGVEVRALGGFRVGCSWVRGGGGGAGGPRATVAQRRAEVRDTCYTNAHQCSRRPIETCAEHRPNIGAPRDDWVGAAQGWQGGVTFARRACVRARRENVRARGGGEA